MKNRNLTNLSLIFPIFIIVFLILCPRYLMAMSQKNPILLFKKL